MKETDILAYYNAGLITTIKSCMIQASLHTLFGLSLWLVLLKHCDDLKWWS